MALIKFFKPGVYYTQFLTQAKDIFLKYILQTTTAVQFFFISYVENYIYKLESWNI